jgi:glucokinase
MKLLFDVGGTEIKAAAVDESGELMGSVEHFDADSNAECDAVFDNMASVIRSFTNRLGEYPTALGMAFPGPFDYENGISLIKGLGKYENIYGRSVPEEIRKRIPHLTDRPFYFLHDVESFALGAYFKGESRGKGKTMFVCIGTGTGTAFIKDGNVLKNEEDGSPKDGWIYEDPFKDGKIDEYISVRGLKRISKSVTGKELTGLEIFKLCEAKDEKGMEIYRLFGEDVLAALEPYIVSFRPDRLVFGGQISKSFCYFGSDVKALCKEKGVETEIITDTSLMAISGLYKHIERRTEGR